MGREICSISVLKDWMLLPSKRIKPLPTDKEGVFLLYDNWVQRHSQRSGRQLVKSLFNRSILNLPNLLLCSTGSTVSPRLRWTDTLSITLTKPICNFLNKMYPEVNRWSSDMTIPIIILFSKPQKFWGVIL